MTWYSRETLPGRVEAGDGFRISEFFDKEPAWRPRIRVRQAIPADIKTIFEPWQLAEYLEVARQSEPFDPSLYEPLDEEEAADIDPEAAEDERQYELQRSAADLLLVEQARSWLLEDDE